LLATSIIPVPRFFIARAWSWIVPIASPLQRSYPGTAISFDNLCALTILCRAGPVRPVIQVRAFTAKLKEMSRFSSVETFAKVLVDTIKRRAIANTWRIIVHLGVSRFIGLELAAFTC